jgi:hypothetical protein
VTAEGGGILLFEEGSVVRRTTVSSNSLTASEGATQTIAEGGGIGTAEALEVASSTITGNSAASTEFALGANLNFSGPQPVRNTIISNPLGGATSCSEPVLSGGFNIDDGTSCGLFQPTDLSTTDPGLDAALAANGGPTPTHALLPGSPAIDRGNGFGEGVDQRGLPRPSDFLEIPNVPGGDGSDVGAVELQAPPAVLDTTPPQTRIDRGPPRKTRKRLARFRFSSSEVGSSFECKLDGRPFRPCASPFKRRVRRGRRHTFRVRAVDPTGNVDPTPAIRKWLVKRRKLRRSGPR